MNITPLTDEQMNVLEIFINGYKHFRRTTKHISSNANTRKKQLREVRRFNDWVVTVAKPHHAMLQRFGLTDIMIEVGAAMHRLNNSQTYKALEYELQVL